MSESLEFLLRLDAEIDGGLKMIRVLSQTEKGLESVEAAIGKTERGTRRAGEGHRKHAKDAEHLGSALDRLVHAGMEPFIKRAEQIAEFEFIRRGVDAILEAPERLIEKVRELGQEILIAAGKAEETQIVFDALFGSEEGERLTEYAEDLSAKTGILGHQWKSIEMTLGNAGFKLDDMRRAAAAVADLGALSGHGAAGAEEAADMFARLQNRGEISPRMLMQFKISEKDFWTELNARTGVGIETLKKNMAKGKVDIAEVKESIYSLITAKTHRDLGGLGADIGGDLNSKWERLKNLPEQFYEKFANSPGYETLKRKLDDIFEAFNPKGPRGEAIFASLEGAITAVVDSVARIDFDHVANVVTDGVLPAIKDIAKTLGDVDWAGGAHLLADVLGVIGQTVDGIVVAYKALGWLKEKTTFNPAVTAAPGEDAGALSKIWYGFKHNWVDISAKEFFGFGKDAADGMAKGMGAGAPAVRDATSGVGYSSMDAMQSTLQIHSPSKVFAGYGEMAATGYSLGLLSGRDSIRAATDETVAIPAPGVGSRGATSVSMGGIHVNVSVSGHGDAQGSADEIAHHLEEILPEQIQRLFERIQVMRGS